MDFVFSIYKGFLLSASVFVTGIVLDYTLNWNSTKEYVDDKKNEINVAIFASGQNLLFVSPLVYSIIDTFLLKHEFIISSLEISKLLLLQNIGYYLMHRYMHLNKEWYKFHSFHHQFDKCLFPTTANAVSIHEFLLAYILPIAIGAFFFEPDEINFDIAIAIISLFNLLIHTNELHDAQWLSCFVSPAKHIEHHLHRNIHFAAPLLDIDQIVEKNH